MLQSNPTHKLVKLFHLGSGQVYVFWIRLLPSSYYDIEFCINLPCAGMAVVFCLIFWYLLLGLHGLLILLLVLRLYSFQLGLTGNNDNVHLLFQCLVYLNIQKKENKLHFSLVKKLLSFCLVIPSRSFIFTHRKEGSFGSFKTRTTDFFYFQQDDAVIYVMNHNIQLLFLPKTMKAPYGKYTME